MKITINVRTMDVIPVIVIIVLKMLLINLMTKRCRRCRPRNVSSADEKEKSGKKGGKLPPTAPKNNGKCNQLMGMFVHFLLALTNETGAQTTTESLHF